MHWGSRWYPGAGIYRNVWLVKTPPLHVGHWGGHVTTPLITADKGDVEIVAAVDNQGPQTAAASAIAEIYELTPNGSAGEKVAATTAGERKIDAVGSAQFELAASVPQPRLWELETPNRYMARIIVLTDGKAVDVDQPFGFRTIEFTPRDGFKLNGRRVPLQGTCNHHDLGPLGSALNLRTWNGSWKSSRKWAATHFALRTIRPPELLDLADRMGMVVMVEAFDCWRTGKSANDYSRLYDKWHAEDLQALVRREPVRPARSSGASAMKSPSKMARNSRSISATSSTPKIPRGPSPPAATTPRRRSMVFKPASMYSD